MNRLKLILPLFIISFSIILGSLAATPQQVSAEVARGCSKSASFLFFPTWYRYLDVGPELDKDGLRILGGDPCAINGPRYLTGPNRGNLNWSKVIPRIGLALVEIMLRIASIAAVGYVMYGGFRFITSQGEPEKAKSARQAIVNALTGLAISLVATGLVAFISRVMTA